ncbi:unnamed protein product [Sphagnum compactum]
MSQWTNKSNTGRRRMQCAYCDVYGHIGIASAQAFQRLILALLQPQRCEVYWRIWQLDIHVDTADLPSAHPVVPLPSPHHIDQISTIVPHPNHQLHLHASTLKHLMAATKVDPGSVLQQSICEVNQH